jgi:Icc-related predicted phosphoesterase
MRPAVRGHFGPALRTLPGLADLLVLAGDLTNGGTLAEAEMLYDEVRDLPLPVVAVLGNHDHDEGHGDAIVSSLESAGIRVLDGAALTVLVDGARVGVAGVMGGGGGFPDYGTSDTEVQSPEDPDRMRRGPVDAKRLRSALDTLEADIKLALTHFAPVPDTLAGEPVEIFPGLGCHLLAEAIDGAGADFAIHGHAHGGSEHGKTPGGVPVRNVAYPVLRRPYAVYGLGWR